MTRRRVILASHLVLHGYGHWLPNDPRGSGSETVRKEELESLGPIHPGRKHVQPPRTELKSFYREAEPRLDHPCVWFSPAMRSVIAVAIERCSLERRYTLHALAVCANHVHAVVRSHSDRSEVIWTNLADATRAALQQSRHVPPDHPVWSHRPYKVFLHTPGDVVHRIAYAKENPTKERLARQVYPFVKPFET